MARSAPQRNIWELPRDERWNPNQLFGLAVGFVLREQRDLSSFSRELPQATTLCSASVVAGIEHVRRILYQASVYWNRGYFLARNRSLDLLMRITCQSQIDRAIEISAITKARKVAVLGLMEKQSIDETISLIEKGVAPAINDDRVLEVDPKKKQSLAKMHGLPRDCSDKQLVSFLEEKSVALVFGK